MAVESIDFAEELLRRVERRGVYTTGQDATRGRSRQVVRRVSAAAIFFVHLHCRDRYEKDQGGFYV